MAPSSPNTDDVRLGFIAALTTFVSWGLLSLFYKSLDHVGPVEILSHRVLWSLAFLVVILSLRKQWQPLFAIFRHRKTLTAFFISSALISVNWGAYIYAVTHGHATEASMGYFIMPLVTALLGAYFFKEPFSKLQIVAVVLAACGVVYLIFHFGEPPWIALTVAITFGLYGTIRKAAPADSLVGLGVETIILTPFALGYWGYLIATGQSSFVNDGFSTSGLLMMAGPATALPLILFAYGARRIRYSTLGFLQYVNPTVQFLIALLVFMEPFNTTLAVTFAFIWAAVIVYSIDSLKARRRKKA